jgi:trimethylamine--corrinoid protein Co-methyltransferase
VRKIPVYNLLDETDLVALENQADWILEEIGIEFPDDDEALALFREAGATVTGRRVRLPPGLARALCATAPAQFRLHGRDPAHTVTIGGDHVVFAPAYGAPFVSDLASGRRYATLADFHNFVKLAHTAPWLHSSGGTVCEPVDVPVNKRHLDMVYAHLRYTTKPFLGAVTTPEQAADSVAMARLVFGADFMAEHCVLLGNINVNSPLVYDGMMTGALKAYARANQGIILTPFILGGAMGPVTQAALVAQALAEALVGIALGQLVRPGSPAIYGSFLNNLDLRSGVPTFGMPEAGLATLAIGQLCRRLGLPLRCGGHFTAAKVADGQALQESADSMITALLAGANFVLHAAGWLEGGLTMSYEKFVIDVDHCGMMAHMLKGLTIDENTLGKAAFREVGPGENFLESTHTLHNFRTAGYLSPLADNNTYEQWQEMGGEDLSRRAHRRWPALLAEYELPEMDPAVDAALLAFIAEKKNAVEDRWY